MKKFRRSFDEVRYYIKLLSENGTPALDILEYIKKKTSDIKVSNQRLQQYLILSQYLYGKIDVAEITQDDISEQINIITINDAMFYKLCDILESMCENLKLI